MVFFFEKKHAGEKKQRLRRLVRESCEEVYAADYAGVLGQLSEGMRERESERACERYTQQVMNA